MTGGTRGIGRATVERLLADGYSRRVLRPRRDGAAAEPPAWRLFVPCDVGVEEEVEALVHACVARFGPPTLLVNNAGVNATYDATTMTEAEWDELLRDRPQGGVARARSTSCRTWSTPGGGAIVNVSPSTPS